MQAMVIEHFGDFSIFKAKIMPKPQVKPGYVLIKTIATSVNPFDAKLRRGFYPDLVTNFPMILHGDIAGIVEEVGAGVSDFQVGDEVYGCVGGLLDMPGALAEYTLADAKLIAHKPKTLSHIEAAALPLVALTTWQALITAVQLKPGQTVLIHGGTGGVGHIAVQLAKHLGAKVYTTVSSSEKAGLARQFGADEVINYQQSSVADYVQAHTNNQGFSLIFDTIGGDNIPNCFQAAALHGSVVTLSAVGPQDLKPAFLKGLSLHMIMQPIPLITGIGRESYGKILIQIAELVDQGKLKPYLDPQRFTLAQIAQAHQYLEEKRAVGKIVVTI
jgi:NADPH2:quinone reductase